MMIIVMTDEAHSDFVCFHTNCKGFDSRCLDSSFNVRRVSEGACIVLRRVVAGWSVHAVGGKRIDDVPLEVAGDAKVRQLHAEGAREEEVGWLDVPVDDEVGSSGSFATTMIEHSW